MSNVWGNNLKVSIFGESHGESIGVVLGGLPPGLTLDLEEIGKQMARRAPGRSPFATSRREDDLPEIQSGLFQGKTTGAPLCALIPNQNQRSRDYQPALPRPSHSDYAAYLKYGGHHDYRGGGHFSGRLTAPLTFAGSVARQFLEEQGVHILSHVCQIGQLYDTRFPQIFPADLNPYSNLRYSPFPVLDQAMQGKMEEAVIQAGADGDSLGGMVEAAVIGLAPGLGSPFFDSLESRIASLLFSIPAVKGVDFGSGFALGEMRGSQANDQFCLKGQDIQTGTNHSGGINGGISNGMPLLVRAVFRPTPSISQAQTSVDLTALKETELVIQGRHDPCVAPRGAVVVESALAIALLDSSLSDCWENF